MPEARPPCAVQHLHTSLQRSVVPAASVGILATPRSRLPTCQELEPRISRERFVGYAPRLKILAALALLGIAAPAVSAEYFAYQGELKFTSSSLPTCTPLSTGTFHVVIVGRNGGPF